MPLSGRKAQAARNDRLILDAAREVFTADPSAPVSAVAERARVGISALYRRYASKEELLRRLCAEGLRTYIAAAEDALADDGDPWNAFTDFMRRVVDADTHSLTLQLAGTFTPTDELNREAAKAQGLNVRHFDRIKAAGAIRSDIEMGDISMLLEQLAAIRVADEEQTRQRRHRYLALLLEALQAPSGSPLVGPGEGYAISQIDLRTEAEVPGVDEELFLEKAEAAKRDCTVSKALARVGEIGLEAKTVGAHGVRNPIGAHPSCTA